MGAMAKPRACGLGVVTVVLATLANVATATPGYTCACGAVVPPVGGQAAVNHEVALAHWNGSSETIVMQLAPNADTNNVALVVPTPTPATVTEGDRATFAALGHAHRPSGSATPALGAGADGLGCPRPFRGRSSQGSHGGQPGSPR